MYRSNKVLLFDDVTVNVGDGFDVASQRFVCPYAGVYGFSLVLNSPANCQLMKQDTVIGFVDAKHAANSTCRHGSTFVISECAAGDAVYVKTRPGGPAADVVEGPSTLFAGFLIKRLGV